MNPSRRSRFSAFSWILADLRAIGTLLKKPETWIFIGLTVVLGVLGGVSLYLTTGLDVSLQLRHLQTISCASASNVQSAAIIVGGMAFVMAGIAALGELATYVDDKRRYRQRVSGRSALLVTVIAMLTGAGLLWLLVSICI